jgi:transposase-like protein
MGKSEIDEFFKGSFFSTITNLGIDAFMEYIDKEVASYCGERYKHIDGREFTRWSNTTSPFVFGGRKILLTHPRVRDIRNGKEKELELVRRCKDGDLLTERQMQQMIIGVSTRKYARSLETEELPIPSHSTSKSTISRNFSAKTQAKLQAWLEEPIKEDYPFLMIDGIVFSDTTVIAILGITKNGDKRALGAWAGSTENSRLCIDLLNALIERGFNVSACKLAVIDGGKALHKAIKDVFGKDMLIQRCQVHKKRNVLDYLPKEKRETMKHAISQAYNADSYDLAKRLLLNIASRLNKDYPSAAQSMLEGLEETLTLHKLGASKLLRQSLCSTNSIESLNSGIRHITKRVKRWRKSDMVMRWVLTGIIESEKNFKKIRGYKDIDLLLINIERFDKKELDGNEEIA